MLLVVLQEARLQTGVTQNGVRFIDHVVSWTGVVGTFPWRLNPPKGTHKKNIRLDWWSKWGWCNNSTWFQWGKKQLESIPFNETMKLTRHNGPLNTSIIRQPLTTSIIRTTVSYNTTTTLPTMDPVLWSTSTSCFSSQSNTHWLQLNSWLVCFPIFPYFHSILSF